MQVKKLRLKHIGPIENLEINFLTTDKTNTPVVFVGLNGTGKSIILSYIADAFIEFKRQFYEDIEVESTKYFKVSSLSYVKNGKPYGFCEITFQGENKEYFYSEVLTLDLEKFKEEFEKEKLYIKKFDINDARFKEIGMGKFYTKEKVLKKEIDNNVLLYFPWNRTEIPAWINKEGIKISFRKIDKFVNRSYRKIVNLGNFEELYSWILDVVLDMDLHENPYDISLQNNLNFIIQEILIDKKSSENEKIRFGIGRREAGSRISIVKDYLNEEGKWIPKEIVCPTIFHLSSGESALLNIFSSILMDYDKQLRDKKEFSLKDITGIVLIDEADLHLHIKLQTEIFPKLLELFPNIQFIITTQSPFLIQGLHKTFQDNLMIIELPTGDLIDPERFIEFKIALKKFYKIGEKYLQQKIALEKKIKILTKPLIITEGKTDWILLKKAKQKLKNDLDIDFYEMEEDLGKNNLITMCENFSKFCHPRPLIFIFDRDLPEREYKKVMDDSQGYKNWGNNVFSFVLPIPSHRKNYKNITIEMFFKDEEIKRKDKNGKRLFFTNEIEKVIDVTTKKVEKYRIVSPKEETEYEKKIFSEAVEKVIDDSGSNKAISKTKFAEYIYKDIPPFNTFDFAEFNKIFNIIEKILNENKNV